MHTDKAIVSVCVNVYVGMHYTFNKSQREKSINRTLCIFYREVLWLNSVSIFNTLNIGYLHASW